MGGQRRRRARSLNRQSGHGSVGPVNQDPRASRRGGGSLGPSGLGNAALQEQLRGASVQGSAEEAQGTNRPWSTAVGQQAGFLEVPGDAESEDAFETRQGSQRSGVWTTGRAGGGGGVTSRELARDGRWSARDFLTHHSDRSGSWAAENIRNGTNQDLQAYDFTFEDKDAQGNPIAGTAQGKELILPFDVRIIDIQESYQGSGGYGKFLAVEDVESGMRLSIHHLDTVQSFRKGQVVKGGTVFGTQGGSGSTRHQYATHVDIIGGEEAVGSFVRSNQTGEYRTEGGT